MADNAGLARDLYATADAIHRKSQIASQIAEAKAHIEQLETEAVEIDALLAERADVANRLAEALKPATPKPNKARAAAGLAD